MTALRSLATAAGLGIALLCWLPAAGHAGEVSRTALGGGFQIVHEPDPSDVDAFVVTEEDGAVFFSLGAELRAGAGCTSPLGQTVRCSAANVTRLSIALDDQDDVVSIGGLFGGGQFSIATQIDAGPGVDLISAGSEPDTIFAGTGDDRALGSSGNDSIGGGDGNDELSGGAGNDSLRGDAGDDRLEPGTGRDDVLGGPGADVAVFGSANDAISLDDVANDGPPGEQDNVHRDVEAVRSSSGDDRITGDSNANVLDAGAGRDALDGGGGADVLDGGAGPDVIAGGTDFDEVVYPLAGDQRVSLDGVADDGAAGEGDNVRTSVESIASGPGNDVLAGNAVANVLNGGDGDDRLSGGAGVDAYFGGPGRDSIQARDGLPELVDCGPGGGFAAVDTIDTVIGCDSVDARPDFVPDLDRDGVDRPPRGSDCDDANPAIRPGAREIANNGVDEDCDGRLHFDRDGDGGLAAPVGDDCDDADPGVHRGAREVPGNRVDENCDDEVEPFPVLESSIGAFFVTNGRHTRITDLFVRRARAGSRVRLVCDGVDCPFRARRVKVKRDRRKLGLRRHVRKARLRPGTRFEVRVTKPAAVGAVARFKMRRAKSPERLDSCAFPGRRRPARCPS